MLIAMATLTMSAQQKKDIVIKKTEGSITFVVDENRPAPEGHLNMDSGKEFAVRNIPVNYDWDEDLDESQSEKPAIQDVSEVGQYTQISSNETPLSIGVDSKNVTTEEKADKKSGKKKENIIIACNFADAQIYRTNDNVMFDMLMKAYALSSRQMMCGFASLKALLIMSIRMPRRFVICLFLTRERKISLRS